MTPQDILVSLGMATIGSLIAKRFKTREKSAEAFAKLELTWPQGIALAVIICAGVGLLEVLMVRGSILP